MINLSKERNEKILSILLKQEAPITTERLAKKLNKSTRTIRNDLKELKKWLKNEGISLITKPRIGVWLEISDNERKKLKEKKLKKLNKNRGLNPEQRQYYILNCLLEYGKKYNIKKLAKKLYVSKSTIYKDLNTLEQFLKKYNLELEKQKECIKINGEEKNWRNLTADLLVELNEKNDSHKILKELKPNSGIDFNTYYSLKKLFKNIPIKDVIKSIEEVLEEMEFDLDFLFTEEAFTGLVIHIMISLERLKANQNIEMQDKQLKKLREKDEFISSEYIAKKLKENLGIELPESEIGYICLHILGAKSQQKLNNIKLEEILETFDEEVIEIAKNIIEFSGNILGVNLNDDKRLLEGLILHLRPAINRLKYGLSLRNPILTNIKNNYPKIFGIAWASSIIFEEKIGIKIKEEEVGYIALHIGAALERKINYTNIILVCGSGIGTSQLLAEKLRKSFVNINIKDSIPLHKLKNKNMNDIDLIVSTIPIPTRDLSIPVVEVNPLLRNEDIKLIESKISKNYSGKANQNSIYLNFNNKSNLFDKNFIYLNISLDSKEKVINYLCNKLLERNIVKKGFANSVEEREKLAPTELTKGIAIPHGEKKYILSSKVVIAKLNKPIKWSEETNRKVDLIFCLALNSQKEAESFFKVFNYILEDDKLLRQIKNAESKQEILEIFSIKK